MTHFVKTAFLLVLLSSLVLLMGNAMGGREGLTVALIFVFIMNFGSYWFSDKIVLSMHQAIPLPREQAPEIYAITEELAHKAGIPVPKIYWVANAAANAFATGRDPEHATIVLTQGLVQSLNSEELRGVIGHEMGHVIHRDTLTSTIVATLAGVIGYAAMMMRWSLVTGGYDRSRSRDSQANPILLLVFSLLMPLAAALVQLGISRTREYAADDKGAELAGNPLYLASALQKISLAARKVPMSGANPAAAHLFIVNPLSGANFASLFSTHPPIEKRIARLEAMAR